EARKPIFFKELKCCRQVVLFEISYKMWRTENIKQRKNHKKSEDHFPNQHLNRLPNIDETSNYEVCLIDRFFIKIKLLSQFLICSAYIRCLKTFSLSQFYVQIDPDLRKFGAFPPRELFDCGAFHSTCRSFNCRDS